MSHFAICHRIPHQVPTHAFTMDRIARLHTQLSAPAAVNSSSGSHSSFPPPASSSGSKQPDVYVSRRDVALDAHVYDAVLTTDALAFVAELTTTFARDIAKVPIAALYVEPCFTSTFLALRLIGMMVSIVILQLHQRRSARRVAIEQQNAVPTFLRETRAIRDDLYWKIDPIPQILQDRRVDIGDVSPANREFLLRSLNSGAQVRCIFTRTPNYVSWLLRLIALFC